MHSEKIIPIILAKGNKICEYFGDGYTGSLYALYSHSAKKTCVYSILTKITTQEQDCFLLYCTEEKDFIEKLLTECRKTDILQSEGG